MKTLALRRLTVAALLAPLLAAGRESPAAAQTAEVVHVRADLVDGPVRLRHGFLHGLDGTASIDFDKVVALKPQSWRLGKVQTYDFVERIDTSITYEIASHAIWRAGSAGVRPWEDWDVYEDYLRAVLAYVDAVRPESPPAFWDVWNEPDHPYFWRGDYEQLLELFARTIRVVRAHDPDAKLVGPSISWYRPEDQGVANIVGFLRELDARYGVRLDAVSWHENGGAFHGGPRPEHVLANTERIRGDLAAAFGPDYKPELHINEHSGTKEHLSPGWNVGYLYYIEQSDVDASMRACWPNWSHEAAAPPTRAAPLFAPSEYRTYEPPGTPLSRDALGRELTCDSAAETAYVWSNCWAGLNGMFMRDGATPQPAYWVYEAYADGDGELRLISSSTSGTTNAIASVDAADQTVRILVGRHWHGFQRADVVVRVSGWPFAGRAVRAWVGRIPHFEEFHDDPPRAMPLPDGPNMVWEGALTFDGGEAELRIEDFADGDAYVVELESDPLDAALLPYAAATR